MRGSTSKPLAVPTLLAAVAFLVSCGGPGPAWDDERPRTEEHDVQGAAIRHVVELRPSDRVLVLRDTTLWIGPAPPKYRPAPPADPSTPPSIAFWDAAARLVTPREGTIPDDFPPKPLVDALRRLDASPLPHDAR